MRFALPNPCLSKRSRLLRSGAEKLLSEWRVHSAPCEHTHPSALWQCAHGAWDALRRSQAICFGGVWYRALSLLYYSGLLRRLLIGPHMRQWDTQNRRMENQLFRFCVWCVFTEKIACILQRLWHCHGDLSNLKQIFFGLEGNSQKRLKAENEVLYFYLCLYSIY